MAAPAGFGAGGAQPFVPGQPYGVPPGQQPAGFQPYGNPPAWGVAPMAVGARRSRRLAILGGGVAALVVAGIVVAVVALSGNGKPSPASAAGAASSAAAAPGATASTDAATAASAVPLGSCPTATSASSEPVGYRACGLAARSVGIPTFDPAQAHRTYTATITTNRGNIVFTADGVDAPYTVYNFVYLTRKQYFDDTVCHRLTVSGIYVLQCGDPSGNGTGGPGYEFQDENLDAFGQVAPGTSVVTYPAGTVAMANAGYDTNGSQFFLVYQDTELQPQYTPFGKVTQGLDILRSIAARGTDNSLGTGDGSPNEPVKIERVTVS